MQVIGERRLIRTQQTDNSFSTYNYEINPINFFITLITKS
jgi:hypothetical protein